MSELDPVEALSRHVLAEVGVLWSSLADEQGIPEEEWPAYLTANLRAWCEEAGWSLQPSGAAPIPMGCRLMLVSDELATHLFTRSSTGRKLTIEWGEPSPEGWYVPTIREEDDGWSLERAGPDHCPAAKHHRVKTTRRGSRILSWTEDGPEVEPDTLESDHCIACGFDFQARALLAPAPPADHE